MCVKLPSVLLFASRKVMSFHRMKLVCFVGGTNINRDLNQLRSGAPDILVATPGRCFMPAFRAKSTLARG